jgi:hypothetical protein
MDVVIAYLYGSLDSDIYMKVPDGIDVPNPKAKRNMYCVKLQKSLYGLKQSGRMWYNRLSEFLLRKGYTKNDDCPCVFIKRSKVGFCIISVYVDDLNNLSIYLLESLYIKVHIPKRYWKNSICICLILQRLLWWSDLWISERFIQTTG